MRALLASRTVFFVFAEADLTGTRVSPQCVKMGLQGPFDIKLSLSQADLVFLSLPPGIQIG